MDNNDVVFNVQELPSDDESTISSNASISEFEEREDGAYPDYCYDCSDMVNFLKLTGAMVDEINELREEVVRWRQALIKHLPKRWAEGLQQDIFDNLYLNVYEDYDAYNYYVNRCCNGIDPFDNKGHSELMVRLSKGTDESSITYL